ncbi:agamous-like MADS-box protein AGL29 [Solanum dulcamara]|uniref:agamous-like MADS-box protein AGL29 n=1 Tax=Solanum dulcamara TaxID=45834 RepID=UPI00248570CC|nr:agamous-like MADS-box protein AGL29 [Solanum dulcamara]
MENETKRGKQKIELKLIECEKTCAVSFSKRKSTLFQQEDKLATRSGADVGVMLFTPSGKPCSYGSTSIEEIIDKFFKVKLEDHQRDYAQGKSNSFEAWENLHKELQAWKEKEKKRILMYKIMHPGSEIPPDKHMEEHKLALMLRLDKIKKETQSDIQVEHFKFDLNAAPEPEENESS